jgi:FxLD family lantipeptide
MTALLNETANDVRKTDRSSLGAAEQFDAAQGSHDQAADAFDLDVTIVSSGRVIAGLMSNTDDGCGSSCESACAGSGC